MDFPGGSLRLHRHMRRNDTYLIILTKIGLFDFPEPRPDENLAIVSINKHTDKRAVEGRVNRICDIRAKRDLSYFNFKRETIQKAHEPQRTTKQYDPKSGKVKTGANTMSMVREIEARKKVKKLVKQSHVKMSDEQLEGKLFELFSKPRLVRTST